MAATSEFLIATLSVGLIAGLTVYIQSEKGCRSHTLATYSECKMPCVISYSL